MATLSTDVLVIGGGATGAGVAWDASLRGYDVVLVDRFDLAEGTSGRFHGLLHSGGRYAVKDPHAAEECIGENHVLRKIAADCIEDTGGFFVTTPWDDPAYGDKFIEGCRATGIDCEEIDPAQALREEPRLNPGISRVFRVPDGSIEVWKTVWALAPRRPGARRAVLPYHAVVAIHRDGDEVTGARVRGHATGEELDIEARVTVNASGAWAGQVAELAGIEGVRVLPGRGIMIAMNHRLVNTVVNRCQMPTDGDIIVPIRTVCVIGTTDVHTDDPDDHTVPPVRGRRDARRRREARPRLPPGAGAAGVDRRASAVRGLPRRPTPTRATSRARTPLLDHAERDGVNGFVTITGGKLTTFRLMAEDTMDAVCRHLGEERPCTTKTEPLPGSESGATYHARRAARAQGDAPRRRAADLRVRAGRALDARAMRFAAAPPRTSTTSAACSVSGWGRARAASASIAPPGSCTGSTG